MRFYIALPLQPHTSTIWFIFHQPTLRLYIHLEILFHPPIPLPKIDWNKGLVCRKRPSQIRWLALLSRVGKGGLKAQSQILQLSFLFIQVHELRVFLVSLLVLQLRIRRIEYATLPNKFVLLVSSVKHGCPFAHWAQLFCTYDERLEENQVPFLSNFVYLKGQPLRNGGDEQCLPVKIDSIVFDSSSLLQKLLGIISCDGSSESVDGSGGGKVNAWEGNSVFLVDIHNDWY